MAVQYTVRQARREDLPGMLKLAVDQGWNEVLENIQIMFDMFPEGSIVAEGADGEIISACISVLLDDSTGQIAMYITKKSCRGQGIGYKVFDLSYKTLGNRNVAINAVWDKVKMYASKYFKVATLTFFIYEFPIKNVIPNIVNITPNVLEKSSFRIVDIKEVDIERIAGYDKQIHPMPRLRALKWALDFALVGRVAFDGDRIAGWGLMQHSYRGFRLMPLYGDTPEVARILAVDLLYQVAGNPEAWIELIFPELNHTATELYSNLSVFTGECHQFKFKRMFTENDVPVPSHFVYSVLSCVNWLV